MSDDLSTTTQQIVNDPQGEKPMDPENKRLRIAAQRVIEAASDGGFHHGEDWATVPARLLRDLKRELDGEPQPSSIKFESMSVS